MRRLHRLQPEGAREHGEERHDEQHEHEPDPPVRLLLAHRGGHPLLPEVDVADRGGVCLHEAVLLVRERLDPRLGERRREL